MALLEMGCARSIDLSACRKVGTVGIAAAYAFAIAKAHACMDGNKRTAFAVAVAFLRLMAAPFVPTRSMASR